MNLRLFVFYLLISIPVEQAIAQQVKYNKAIVGSWKGTKKETRAGRDTLNNGKKMREISIYEFQTNGTVIDKTVKEYPKEHEYAVTGDILRIGQQMFKIEKLNKTTLVLLDYNPNDPKDILAFRHYFARVTSHK